MLGRKEVERVAMPWSDDREMPPVERDDRSRVEALGERDDRRIGSAEPEIGVLLDEIADPLPIVRFGRIDLHRRKTAEKRRLGVAPNPAHDPIRRLRDDEGGYHQPELGVRQCVDRALMSGVGRVRGSDQRTGVNDCDH